MLVSDLMNPDVITADADDSVSSVARLMSRGNLGCIPIVSAGKLKGLCTDRDIVLRCIAAGKNTDNTPVGSVMSQEPLSVSPDDDIRTAARMMATGQIRRLPVVDKGKLVGMLSLGDLARCTACDMEAADALSEISSNIRRR